MSFFGATSPVRSPSATALHNALQTALHNTIPAQAYFPAVLASSTIVGRNPLVAPLHGVGMQTRCLSGTSMALARVKSQAAEGISPYQNSKSTRKVHDVPVQISPSYTGEVNGKPKFNVNPFEAVGMVPGGVTMEWGQDGALRVVPQKVKPLGGAKHSSIKATKPTQSGSPDEASVPSPAPIIERRAYGSVPPIPTQVPIQDARKGSLDGLIGRRRPSFKIDIPAPPSAGAFLREIRGQITPIHERTPSPASMRPTASHSGARLLNARRASKDAFIILGIQDPSRPASKTHEEEMHEVAREYKAAKGMGGGYSLNRRVSTPWTQKESEEWLEMSREDSVKSLGEDEELRVLRNTMANARM